jgi:hypothetical protein
MYYNLNETNRQTGAVCHTHLLCIGIQMEVTDFLETIAFHAFQQLSPLFLLLLSLRQQYIVIKKKMVQRNKRQTQKQRVGGNRNGNITAAIPRNNGSKSSSGRTPANGTGANKWTASNNNNNSTMSSSGSTSSTTTTPSNNGNSNSSNQEQHPPPQEIEVTEQPRMLIPTNTLAPNHSQQVCEDIQSEKWGEVMTRWDTYVTTVVSTKIFKYIQFVNNNDEVEYGSVFQTTVCQEVNIPDNLQAAYWTPRGMRVATTALNRRRTSAAQAMKRQFDSK